VSKNWPGPTEREGGPRVPVVWELAIVSALLVAAGWWVWAHRLDLFPR